MVEPSTFLSSRFTTLIGQPQIEVKATAGNNKLGGDDFDERIIEWLVSEFKRETGIDLSKDNQAMSRLKGS